MSFQWTKIKVGIFSFYSHNKILTKALCAAYFVLIYQTWILKCFQVNDKIGNR